MECGRKDCVGSDSLCVRVHGCPLGYSNALFVRICHDLANLQMNNFVMQKTERDIMSIRIYFYTLFMLAMLFPITGASSKEKSKDHLTSSLKKYNTNGYDFEAGFVPDKTEYVWGEPMYYFTYVIKNIGNKTLSFEEGGDYRGGRSEGHKITAVDTNGKPVAVPEMPMMGGLVHIVNLKPGEVYTKMLPISRRLTFSGPGVYTITGKRTLKLGKTLEEARNLKVLTTNSFQLTIHPYSKERMAKVIEALAAQIWNAGNISPKALEYTEPTEMNEANRLYLALSSLTVIKDEAALEHLISMAETGPIELRAANVKLLGGFPEDEVLAVVLEALDDNEETIRAAAAEALGTMKTDAAIDILIERLPQSEPQVAAAILRAMGQTKSQRAFDIIVEYSAHKDDVYRYGAVDGLARFDGANTVEALKERINVEKDMDLREYIVKTLAEAMRQPIDPQWLVPVIKSRKGTHSIGDAPRLMRLYSGARSVPALLSCLDYENPSIRSSYNWWVIYSQSSCDGGLRTPWISDLNRNGTPEEIENNRKTLKIIKAWVEHYYKYRMAEKSKEKWPDWWGEPVDGISIRARLNQWAWPKGMPQLIMFDARSHPGEGTVNISNVPEPLEVELNGDWYVRQPALKEATAGLELMGKSVQNIVLDENWLRKSDGQPLELKPGEYTLRVGLSTTPENRRTGLAISKAIQFEVIETD